MVAPTSPAGWFAGVEAMEQAKSSEEEAERKRLDRESDPVELVLNLDYIARTYGLDEPYDFEIGLSLLGNSLVMRGRRKKR